MIGYHISRFGVVGFFNGFFQINIGFGNHVDHRGIRIAHSGFAGCFGIDGNGIGYVACQHVVCRNRIDIFTVEYHTVLGRQPRYRQRQRAEHAVVNRQQRQCGVACVGNDDGVRNVFPFPRKGFVCQFFHFQRGRFDTGNRHGVGLRDNSAFGVFGGNNCPIDDFSAVNIVPGGGNGIGLHSRGRFTGCKTGARQGNFTEHRIGKRNVA